MATQGPQSLQGQPTQEQIAELQRRFAADAKANGMTLPQWMEFQNQIANEAKARGMTVPEFMEMQQKRVAEEAKAHGMNVQDYVKKKQMEAQAQAQAQAQGQAPPQQQEQQQQPIAPGPPNPAALAVATFLKSQDLKVRTCILNGQRKDMFKVKRALRALQSPAYEKARKKNPLLPEITDRASLENAFKLLPLSLLALRVSKSDPHEGHDHAPPAKTKRVKGLWTVKIEPQQECREELHFVWLYEGSQIKMKLYAAGALAVIFAIVLFPLWPVKMRLGVWYLSMGMLGLIGLFFAMSIFRLILFVVTMFAVPPGLWLYPNLFEDVGFFDSFRPVWGWQEEKKKSKKKSKASSTGEIQVPGQPPRPTAFTSSAAPQIQTSHRNPVVEEVFDDDD